jgi:hypothetical protein
LKWKSIEEHVEKDPRIGIIRANIGGGDLDVRKLREREDIVSS